MLGTRDVRSKGAAPPDRRASQDRLRASPEMPAILILRQGLSQQDPLIRGTVPLMRAPRHNERGRLQMLPPLAVMMVASAHHLITPASVTGCLRPDLGKTPLTRSAVRLTRATQGRREIAPRTRNIGSVGQDRRRPPSDQPSGRAVPPEPRWDSTGGTRRPRGSLGSSLTQNITRIKPAHSRPTEWAPTTDKDESHPNGAKTQR